ncbi:hypothetical protein PROFUN_03070 [Planoprotostelium fungivorum]|uniref:Uncharacterized protein n=1 Tax=Planoprotostelium fungivorum TaxID=1890364 RepID=A0A2P6NQ59_9EUKA|nr:hypothetical protein PROFUN_03070 [Planoprotostelium fungivorum]
MFCRSLFSALVNKYPPPTIIKLNDKSTAEESELNKITGFSSIADSLKADDLVIYVAHDVWFQLPPEVVQLRFESMKKKKNVVWAADKECWPNHWSSKACNWIPDSTLPTDIYGNKTDVDKLCYRPRWLNSGAVLGRGDRMKKMFKYATTKLSRTTPPPTTTQGILAEVFQERYKQEKYVLDYESEFIQTMTKSVQDVMWSNDLHEGTLSSSPLSTRQYPKKIDLRGLLDETNSPWRGRNLAWNRITNSVPAAIHLNGWDGEKIVEPSWTKMWWFDELLEITEKMMKDEKAGAWVGETWKSWNDLCGEISLF